MPTLKGTEASLSYVQYFSYLVSSSINVSIFRSTWLDTFRTHSRLHRKGLVGSGGNSFFNLCRNSQTAFQSGCISLYSHPQVRVFQFSHIFFNTYYNLCLITAILPSVRCHFIVTLICISLMINDVEQLFMFLLGTPPFFTIEFDVGIFFITVWK